MNQGNKDTKEYEISFVVANQEAGDDIKTILNQYGGEVFYSSPVAEIRLAYPIKKTSHAYFGFLHFRSSPEVVEKVTQSLKLKPAVLRTLLVTPPISKGGKPQRSPRKEMKDQKIGAGADLATVAPSKSGGVLTNEALEEKLEEILK